MIRPALVFALLPLQAFAQLQLFQFDGTTERPVIGGLFDLGAAAVDDTQETRFRVRNVGSSAVTIQTISVKGDGFRLAAQPALPYVLASQNTVDFRVSFSPRASGSYSATMLVNTLSTMLRAAGIATVAVSFNGATLNSGMTADFGRTERGTTVTRSFTLTNSTNSALDVNSIAVSGDAFQGPIGITVPLRLDSQASASFDVVFSPPGAQVAQGTLRIDQRSFVLLGSGFDPPLPKCSLVVEPQAASSAKQMKLSVALAAASKVSGVGTLAMEFRPNPGLPDDAAIQFLSGPQRKATVTIAPGDSAGLFNGQAAIGFQTGTTAGTIVFTLTMTNSSDQLTLPIAPAIVGVDNAFGTRRANDLDVSITGFDNTHSVSQLSFTFYDQSGRTLQPGVIRLDASPDFKRYFESPQALGGSFLMRATFPVSGDATQVASVDVQIVNSAGIASTQRLSF